MPLLDLWTYLTGSEVKEKTLEDLVNFAKENGGKVIPFNQGDILESFDPVFKEGACSGLATEYTRYIMKAENREGKEPHTPENFIKKLNRKFTKRNGNISQAIYKLFSGSRDVEQPDIQVSGNMKDRVSQYQTILPPQDTPLDKSSSILDAILPVKSSSANTFVNVVHSIDFLSPAKGNHRTAIHYKDGSYIIFDPNLGIIKFTDRQKCNKFLLEMKNYYCQGAGCSLSTINLSTMVADKGFGKRDGTKVDRDKKDLTDHDKKKFLIEYILMDPVSTEKHLLKAVEQLAEGDKLLSAKFRYQKRYITLLEIAAYSENKEAVELLLEKGVSQENRKKALKLAKNKKKALCQEALEKSIPEAHPPESPETSSGNDANMNIFSQIGVYIYNKCSEIYQIISGAIFGTSNTPEGNIVGAPASPPASRQNEKAKLIGPKKCKVDPRFHGDDRGNTSMTR